MLQAFCICYFLFCNCVTVMLLEQVQGLWRVRNQNMSDLCEEVKELKDKFLSFEISHVLRVGKVDSVYNLCSTILLWVCITILVKCSSIPLIHHLIWAAYNILRLCCIPKRNSILRQMLKQTWQSVLWVRLSNLSLRLCSFWILSMVNLIYQCLWGLFAMQMVKSRRRSSGSRLNDSLLLGMFWVGIKQKVKTIITKFSYSLA